MRSISPKKLAQLGGRVPSSSITGKKKGIRKKPRSKSERERIYGPPGYVEWCKSQTCVACRHSQRSDVAHIQTGGVGRKDDWTRTVPLCSRVSYRHGCHGMLHLLGRKTFEDFHNINLDDEAERNHARWLAYQSGGQPKGVTKK